MKRFTGIGVSPGVVAGRAVILSQRAHTLRYYVPEVRVPDELARLDRSRARTREQLTEIRALVAARRGPELAGLFDAQLLMLDDAMLLPRAAELVRTQQVNAEWAVEQVFDELGAVFDEVADHYLRERKGNLADLVGRLRMNLHPGTLTPRDLLREIEDGSVLVADELTPSVAAQIDWSKVRGFATDAGSRIYHTAILARSLDVPAVVGLHNASAAITPGRMVVIDADAGALIADPDGDLLARVAQPSPDDKPAELDAGRATLAVTADGIRIRLEANIEFPDDLAAARYAGAEGIGLFRSEFLLAGRAHADEEEQFRVYRTMLEGMAPGPVTVRTFDLGEDQVDREGSGQRTDDGWAAEEPAPRGEGLRGLRLSLSRPETFRVQLRALLRAARHGHLRIVFPFVSSVVQVRDARRLVSEVAAELENAGQPAPHVPIGAMIEIPAAGFTSDLLAREVDFFTIGTNDLIQYCLAVDRSDDRVSRFYEPVHPAILRVLRTVRRAASRQGIQVSVCGEMASDPVLLALLTGLGLREFSMTPSALGRAKQMLGEIRVEDMRRLAQRVLRLPTVAEIEHELLAVFGRLSLTRE